jgi:MoaA/NifB/PqqE/SkfB family radical SAM enzyme
MSKILNLKPEIKQAGFDEIFVKSNITDFQIFDKLRELIKKINSDSDLRYLNIIYNSYDKFLFNKNANILQTDFILNEYEKLELSKFFDNEKKIVKYLVYRYKYVKNPILKIIEEYPPCVQIEPASICNYRCVMCYQSDTSFSDKKNNFMGFMQFDLFKKIIDEIEGKVQGVTLASRGEPTLNKKIIDFINYCKGKFVALKLNTNLSNMTEELASIIFTSNVQTLVISADSPIKEIYEKIRVKGNFDTIIKNLKLLKNTKKKYPESKCIIRVSGVKINSEQNLMEMSKIYGEFCDSVSFVNYLPWESSYTNPINNVDKPCSDLWKRIFVWYDGKINPCDYDYKSYLSKHNFNQHNIKIAWNSDYYSELRQKHLLNNRKSLSPCNRCNNI